MDYTFDFFFVGQGLPVLFKGLWMTLQLTLAANIIGLSLGFAVSLLSTARNPLIRMPTSLFIEFFRCTPVIIQVIWFFYCVPLIFNVFLDPFVMGVLTLGLNLTAFNAEAYRAAIQSVPREQLDAGVALGLNPMQRVMHIVLPHAWRQATPVLMTNGITIFQQSALVAIVAIQDLMYMGKQLATESYRPIETFTTVALMYFAISFPLSQLVQYLERRRACAGH